MHKRRAGTRQRYREAGREAGTWHPSGLGLGLGRSCSGWSCSGYGWVLSGWVLWLGCNAVMAGAMADGWGYGWGGAVVTGAMAVLG